MKDFPDSDFYYKLAFEFLPRKYAKDTMILSQGDDASEIFFIISGELKVFFEYEHEGKTYEVSRFFNKGYYFGDYGVLSDHVSEF